MPRHIIAREQSMKGFKHGLGINSEKLRSPATYELFVGSNRRFAKHLALNGQYHRANLEASHHLGKYFLSNVTKRLSDLASVASKTSLKPLSGW